MKKNIFPIIATLAIIILLGAGAYFMDIKIRESFFSSSSTQITPTPTATADNFFSGSYSCNISSDKTTTIVYINKGIVRADSTASDGKVTSALYKDNMLYMWDTTTYQGSSTTMPGLLSLATQMIEKYKSDCKPTTTFQEGLFDIPTNVKFTNNSSASPLQALQNLQNNIQGK